jgi:hypothetical protein
MDANSRLIVAVPRSVAAFWVAGVSCFVLITVLESHFASSTEFRYSFFPKGGTLSDLPSASVTYYYVSSYSWLLVATAVAWGSLLSISKSSSIAQLTIYTGLMLNGAVLWFYWTLSTIYFMNQRLIFVLG